MFVFLKGNVKYRKGGNGMRMMFGEYIHQKRINKEIPLREFARRIGVSAEYICNIEKGRKGENERIHRKCDKSGDERNRSGITD